MLHVGPVEVLRVPHVPEKVDVDATRVGLPGRGDRGRSRWSRLSAARRTGSGGRRQSPRERTVRKRGIERALGRRVSRWLDIGSGRAQSKWSTSSGVISLALGPSRRGSHAGSS